MNLNLYLLKTKCPKCGAPIGFRNIVNFGKDIPDAPDIPWVDIQPPYLPSNIKRYDTCANGHNLNIRPYADYDEHYIYEDKLAEEITRLETRLSDLKELIGKEKQNAED